MITDGEKRALQLAKKVFEHFTHDALPIAREILAMELELREPPVNGEPNSIPDIKKTDVIDFPDSDLIGLDDPAQPVKHLSDELVYSTQDSFPF